MSTAAKVGAFLSRGAGPRGRCSSGASRTSEFGRGRRKRSVSVEFSNVAGLTRSPTVRVAGVRVGKVKDIRLTSDSKAIVDLDLDRASTLRKGASASIAELGLLGDKYVELLPGPAGAPPLPAGSTLPGEVPIGFDEITKLARDIEVDIKDITKNLKQSLRRAARRGAAAHDRGQREDHPGRPAQARRIQPRQRGRHDRKLPGVLDPDDGARPADRPARRVEPDQRDRQRRQRQGAVGQARRRRSTT